MTKITREQLVAALTELATNRKSASIVTITAKTDPKVKKGSPRGQEPANRFFGNCVKVARVNGIVNWKYANSVNNQRAREWQPVDESGDLEHFEAQPRKWGVRQEGLPFVEHNGNLYLEMKVERSLEHRYESLDGGETFDNEAVEAWITRRRESARQGTDKPVILRDYAVASITGIAYGGEQYQVEG